MDEPPDLIPRSLEEVWTDPYPTLPHVLLVVDQFPKSLGGGERTVLRLAELLPRYGFRASVLTFAIDPESCLPAGSSPFPVYLLPLDRTYNLKACTAALRLGRFLRQQDIVLVQTFFESSDLWAGSVVKTLSRAKLVWSRRDMGILRSAKHRLAYRMMAGLADGIFAVSDRVREHCIQVDRVDSARVRTIYNGHDFSPSAAPSGLVRDRFTVTTLGNMRRVKGHDLFIQAAALVLSEHPDTFFSIAGDVLEAVYVTELRDQVRKLGISERFHFIGRTNDARSHLESADLFVLPSRSEGFSNAILEAMACSLPVIATDVGGNAEAVSDGVSGFIIPPEDPVALARAIAQLVNDRAMARRMGAAGRLLAEEKFSTDAMMKKVTLAYRDIIAQKSVPSCK